MDLMSLFKLTQDESADFHQIVADMAGISRTQAKTINLGLFTVWVKLNYLKN